MPEQKNIESQEYVLEIRRTLMPYVLFGMINCIGVYVAGKSGLLPGLILGLAAGVVYFLMMARRVNRSVLLPADKAVWYMRTGWVARFAFIVMIFLVSLHYPQFDIWATMTGFFSLYLVILFNAVVMALKLKKYR